MSKGTSHSGMIRAGCSLGVLIVLFGCSPQKMLMQRVAGSFDNAMTAYTSENDPELVKEALPSTLKMIDVLLTASPDNPSLLTAGASGYTMYSQAFLMYEADRVEEQDLQKARMLRSRGKHLFLRAKDYGLKGLNAKYPGFKAALDTTPEAALSRTNAADIPLLYWTAASWGSAIGIDTEDYELILNLSVVEKLIQRALALDETWGGGQLHQFMISFEAGRSGLGGSMDAAEKHFQRALELSNGQSAGVFVVAAEALAIPQQDRERFKKLLHKALQIDPDTKPSIRLATVIAQERARWLLDHIEKFFI